MYARRSICVLLGFALVIVAQTPPAAQTRPAAAADIPRLQFEKYSLPNGLEVILSQNRRLPVVAVNLWYHVGPANEEPGRTGFAHLFEHMMFQGSKHVPPDGHFQLLEKAGATGLNGTTDYDRTNYFETVPANQLEIRRRCRISRMSYATSGGRASRTSRTGSPKKPSYRHSSPRDIRTSAASSDRTRTSSP
jgi:zinc protease